ncbi:hypothetical protein ASPZODRAFT_134075 [Penicilliopsis zonata CBS 506.65]|uniref:BUB protein kinase n=1 Tax=Penicilliopsis zonata CBS 506.65 TaxID=1073090 RepID=A0A1L9SE43_9EURO|nr:hypothetical protein ASPZODRAFT_134075 [Penicilliopsis zonata CBS 506.65]OJJ45422.1 hypothetical protein ASPZODRAFT_134075 [Penicilliopsis zonata CBS 506.65]
MATSNDPVDFDILEAQKENVQSLPGGRSARELARIFSAGKEGDKYVAPSPNDTRTLNDAIREEYEAELQLVGESDDPLDVYDRYVKWMLNAYPSAQATAESGLLPLLEKATKAFLSSPHYKNDPRYLRLWLHYIRLFSDAPRETFAFLARHHIGESLALFYEEFAAWLESAGRWSQAEEVYMLGLQREARPVERLHRKFNEFQQRYEQRTQDTGPSSPALPAVRPALAAKVNPFSAAAESPSSEPQAQPDRPTLGGGSKTKSGKPKMAIFSDADAASVEQPALGAKTTGWEGIGSLSDRRKENKVEARPWTGETLKAGKKPAPVQKMAIFRDESQSKQSQKEAIQPKQIPEHHVREAINPRSGRRERVFVDLEAVYPDRRNPNHEISFEELRAMNRGWMDMDWKAYKQPLEQISGNVPSTRQGTGKHSDSSCENEIPSQLIEGLVIDDTKARQHEQRFDQIDGKSGKARRLKVREVKEEPQTIKMNFDSPAKAKIRRKSTAEPTMTIHTRAATDEIYSIFNQPLKAETEERADSLCGSDYEDDDYTSAGESTCTGHISAASSDFGEDETNTSHRFFEGGADEDGYSDETHAESLAPGEWTEFTAREHNHQELSSHNSHPSSQDPQDFEDDTAALNGRGRFVPEMPEDYDPPYGPYRDPAIMAQNRLPFMTPIVERTEYSISMTAARNHMYDTKTPSKPMHFIDQTPPKVPAIGDLLSSPSIAGTPQQEERFTCFTDDVSQSPMVKKMRASPLLSRSPKVNVQKEVVIDDMQCNPTTAAIREAILLSLNPPLSTYHGYVDHSAQNSDYASEIRKFTKTLGKRSKSGDKTAFEAPALDISGAERNYIIKRELGAGAYAPVYLAESVESLEEYQSSEPESEGSHTNASQLRGLGRGALEALKLEVGPPNPWEFYMIKAAHERLFQHPKFSRAAESIVRVHEMHIFQGESLLVEDYRDQGTLLDLINVIRKENLATNSNDPGMDEVLAMFFAVELFRTVEALHACGILHGDIKADNCLVRFDEISNSLANPSHCGGDDENADPREIHYSPDGNFGWRNKGLALIDFGRAIDMHAFQPSVQFIADWEPGPHECNEIREMRPWTHQIDLYGMAGTIHVMLFGKYIESTTAARGNEHSNSPNPRATVAAAVAAGHKTYRIRESLKRYWDRELWNDVFDLLLNPLSDRWTELADRSGPVTTVPEGKENTRSVRAAFPVLAAMKHVRQKMETWLLANAEKKGLALQIRKLEAVFAERKRKTERR